MACIVLVVAKAPVAGLAKTRLAAAIGAEAAAGLAAAALLDTLDAVRDVDATAHVVALTGDLALAHRAEELEAMLADFVVLPQRGDGLDERLAAAHADAAPVAPGPVLQIGMDTPQVSPGPARQRRRNCLPAEGVGGVFGPATDGGWWALGLSGSRFGEVPHWGSRCRSPTPGSAPWPGCSGPRAGSCTCPSSPTWTPSTTSGRLPRSNRPVAGSGWRWTCATSGLAPCADRRVLPPCLVRGEPY